MQALKKLLVKLLKDTAYKIEAGTCEISFNRFYADCMFMNNPIDWDDML